MVTQQVDTLKDLGEICHEIRKNLKEKFSENDVILSEGFKIAFAENMANSDYSVEFNMTTAIITNNQAKKLKIYVPNQWFVLASYPVGLFRELYRYKGCTEKILDEMVNIIAESVKGKKDKKEIYKDLKNGENEDINNTFKSLVLNYFKNEGVEESVAEKNTELLYKFVSDFTWWNGGKTIDRHDFAVSPILSVLNLVNDSQAYIATLTKLYASDENLHNQLSTMIYSESDGDISVDIPESVDVEENTTQLFKGWVTGIETKYERNRIVFGAPGTGKSFKLKEDSEQLLKGSNGTFERVTFHPDYSYAKFVGTYKPVTNSKGDISYEFVPGPFLRVYVEAINNRECPHLLLVEEINRAKVAAVFGDVFQLLDRNDEGISEYEIETSEDIRKYLAKELNDVPDNWKKIKLPDNMFIWATMNSADQGVFPMDTAFKRRWDFEYLGINENEDKIKGKIILGTGDDEFEVVWNRLRKAINEKMVRECKVNEDKLIGPFFLSKTILETISDTDNTIANKEKFIKAFKSKVIMYLYEDAVKQYKSRLFSGCDSTKYSSVCDAFDKIGIEIFGDDFKVLYDQQEG